MRFFRFFRFFRFCSRRTRCECSQRVVAETVGFKQKSVDYKCVNHRNVFGQPK